MKKTFLIYLFLCFATTHTFSYNTLAHRTIADIAYRHLSCATKKKIDKVLGERGMVYYASWADEVRSDNNYAYSYDWHFQNLSDGITKETIQQLMDYPEREGKHLFFAIDSLSKKLKETPKNQEALLFLVHFMGDLHQPLHLGRETDLGGNLINIKWFGNDIRLHQLWDKQMVESQYYSYSEYSAYLIHKFKKNSKLKEETLLDAVWQVYLLRNRVYAYDYTGSYSYRYLYEFSKELDVMLYRAGIQLAKLLNDIY